jgi:hypothetical protein
VFFNALTCFALKFVENRIEKLLYDSIKTDESMVEAILHGLYLW